jgi:hypothetical protein
VLAGSWKEKKKSPLNQRAFHGGGGVVKARVFMRVSEHHSLHSPIGLKSGHASPGERAVFAVELQP